jgi:hypothetical protein
LRTAEELRKLPISLLAELQHFYLQASTGALPFHAAAPYVAAHIGADAVEHVAKQFSEPSPERQLVLEVVQGTRDLQHGSDEAVHIAKLVSLERSLNKFYAAHPIDSPYEQLTYAAALLAPRAYSRSSSYNSTNDVLLAAQRAISTMQATANAANTAQEAEARWQSRQLIRGINATLKGKPWPSLS